MHSLLTWYSNKQTVKKPKCSLEKLSLGSSQGRSLRELPKDSFFPGYPRIFNS